ncbi:MAG TPA: hypothetical protein VG937_07125 [Polyangiaceae bacterium]|jgi:hypothetical protein|nr:hypothetical protein [Polyangiaceae bacterium]
MRSSPGGAFGLFFALFAGPAMAQQGPTVELAARAGSSQDGSPASKETRSPILPEGRLELGGELAFLTAKRDLTLAPLNFSDVALLPLHVRASPSRWLELSAGTSLLIKQAEAMSEPIWQGSDLALRVPFGSAFAGSVHGALGPLLNDQGLWWQGESSFSGRFEANEFLRFELRSGYTLTALRYDQGAAPNAWIHELMAHGELQFFGDFGGAWLGIDYFVPVESGPNGSTELRPGLDPNVRVNLEVGAVLSPRRTNWDLYVAYVVVDRGDVEHPETTLPILNGGFDQRLLVLGVQHHFDLSKKREGSVEPWQ